MATTPKSVTKSSESNPSEVKTLEHKHLGTHPDSFSTHDLERNFSQTDDDNLDERRWIKNEFFDSHGPTTVIRLDELTNLGNKTWEGRGDTTDRELGREIIMRAGLSDHPRFNQLCDMMSVALGEINDPGDWLHGYSPKRSGENSSTSSSSS